MLILLDNSCNDADEHFSCKPSAMRAHEVLHQPANMNRARFTACTLLISAGAIVWALHFTILYGLTALACARGFTAALPWIIGLTTVVAVLGLIAIAIPAYRKRQQFEYWMTSAIATIALLATIWEGWSAFLVPHGMSCA